MEPAPPLEMAPTPHNAKFDFPFKLHSLLECAADHGLEDIIAWLPSGQGFLIRDPKAFAARTISIYFGQIKYKSFQRQLAIYGFKRLVDRTSPFHGAYSHPYFVRGKPGLSLKMKRTKIKKEGLKAKEQQFEPETTSSSHRDLKRDNASPTDLFASNTFANMIADHPFGQELADQCLETLLQYSPHQNDTQKRSQQQHDDMKVFNVLYYFVFGEEKED